MRTFLLLTLLLAPSAWALQATLIDPLEPVYTDSTPADFANPHWQADVPRGSIASVHVLVDQSFDQFELTHHWHGQTLADMQTSYLIPVPVEQNTGMHSRTERFDGRENPHVIRRAPFEIYEAISPQPLADEMPEGQCLLELRLPIAAAAEPGLYTLTIQLNQGETQATLQWDIRVYEATLPPPGRDTLGYTNWLSLSNVASYHEVELWSEAFWQVIENYATLMAEGRQNMFTVPWQVMMTLDEQGMPVLNRERFVRWVNTFHQAGLYYLELMHLAHRPQGDWSATELELSVVNHIASTPEGQAALHAMLTQLHDVLTEQGWLEQSVIHLIDEPTNTNAQAYHALAAQVREHLPNVPIFDATMTRELSEAIDIWCPQAHLYQRFQDFFEARREAGDTLWVYTCLVPGGPWLNRLMDQERLRQVYIGWACAKYDLAGYLHWGLNYWFVDDPLNQSVVQHPQAPGSNNFLPAGDTHLVFPAPSSSDSPLRSTRFEAHRLGMEDHALLMQLMEQDEAQAQTIITQVVRGFDDYETEVEVYRATRRALLEALE